MENMDRKMARSYTYYVKRKGMETEKRKRFGVKQDVDRIENKYFKKPRKYWEIGE